MAELITKLDPREFTRIFFTDSEAYSRITKQCKNDNAYLFTLMMSKKYPVLAHQLSNVMNSQIIDQLRSKLIRTHRGKIPQWVFTPLHDKKAQVKSDKKAKSEYIKIYELDCELINSYKKAYDIDEKTFDYIAIDNSAELLKDLKRLDKELHIDKSLKKKIK